MPAHGSEPVGTQAGAPDLTTQVVPGLRVREEDATRGQISKHHHERGEQDATAHSLASHQGATFLRHALGLAERVDATHGAHASCSLTRHARGALALEALATRLLAAVGLWWWRLGEEGGGGQAA